MKDYARMLRLGWVLCALILILGGCARQLPDVSFGGFKATYEVGQSQLVDPYALHFDTESTEEPGQENQEPLQTEEITSEQTAELTDSPTGTLSSSGAETQTPAIEGTPNPADTAAPRMGSKEAFYSYWKGKWALWFESNGRLLETKIEFETGDDNLIGKTEMDGKSYIFTINYDYNHKLYESFASGIWIAEGMQNGFLFRLKAVTEDQAAGHHSRPSQTLCMSRDSDKKPDPCFVPFISN